MIYALSSLANSGDSLVIDRKKITRPITRATRQLDPTEAIIYEMSVRDFSVQKEAGFKHPGKFKGLTESPQLNGRSLDLITFKNWALPMYSYFQFTISVVSMKRINGKPTTGAMILFNTMFQKAAMRVILTILMRES